MGAGCSTAKRRRRKIEGNSTQAKNGQVQKEMSQGSTDLEQNEADDELGALSPASELSKSGGTRGLSSASTVLPGTSISLSPATEDVAELESIRPLPDLEEFSQDDRELLMGRCPTLDPRPHLSSAEIHLLVLANGTDGYRFFSDIQKDVIEPLKEVCFERDVTLRVHIFGEPVPCATELRHLTTEFVKSLLATQRLITLTVFGHPSTHVQPPDLILQQDLDATMKRMRQTNQRELIHCCYSADGNAAVPCYRLQTLSPEVLERQLPNILQVLESAMDEKVRDAYLTSVFEDILRLFLNSDDSLLFSRSFLAHLETTADMEDAMKPRREDVRMQHALCRWEDRLPDDHHFNFLGGDAWEELWNGDVSSAISSRGGGAFSNLETKLRRVLISVLPEEDEEDENQTANQGRKGIPDHLRQELFHQTAELRNHLQSFRDRPALLSSLMSYLTSGGEPGSPLMVHGRQGRGKSALLAVGAVLCGALFPAAPLLLRFGASSPESFTQERIMRSLWEQVALLYGEHSSIAFRSMAEHNANFFSLLRRARAERPMVIFLDGLDQVDEHSGRSLKWCPAVLPPHVRLVIALRDGSGELQELQEQFSQVPEAFLEVPDMDINDTLSIVDHRLHCLGRRLTNSQINFIRICLTENSYPRYAYVLAEAAATWRSLTIPEHFWSQHSIVDVFDDYVQHITQVVDKEILKGFIAGIMSSKHGIMDSEVIYVSRMFKENTRELDVLYLKHKLSFILRTYTRRRHSFYQFKCQIFRKVCKGNLGSEILDESLKRLLTFFDRQQREDVQLHAGSTIITNHKHQRWRQLEEQTHLKIKLNISVRRNFFSHSWLLERVCSGDPYLLLEEIKLYRRRNPDDREFDILRKFLEMSSFALTQDGRQLYSQLHGRVRNFFADIESSIKYPTIKRLYQMSATPNVPSFISRGPCLRTIADAQNPHKSLSSNETQYFSRITWLDQDAKYFVTVSSGLDNVSVWSASQLKRVTTLSDVTCVEDLVPLRQGTAEVLLVHHNRIDLYDLSKGTQTAQMVELVDVSQSAKVLPGGKKVLAVSATHDALLLFEIVTGHVACRMSAGEKRRLEGLTLSGNGHMCVCGDGLRKPYPLLAWDVRKGTLLQQMSIRHHEYVIKHTRVDEEGRKVIAVAKDLLDSSPNFVVAYDLATGGLLWETRAGANLTALDFCRERNLVLAATCDRKIHAWDGAKGVKRFARNSAYDIDRVVYTADGVFLTWQAHSKDRSIKIFDIKDGSSVAVFTADRHIMEYSTVGNIIALTLGGQDCPAVILLNRVPGHP